MNDLIILTYLQRCKLRCPKRWRPDQPSRWLMVELPRILVPVVNDYHAFVDLSQVTITSCGQLHIKN